MKVVGTTVCYCSLFPAAPVTLLLLYMCFFSHFFSFLFFFFPFGP